MFDSGLPASTIETGGDSVAGGTGDSGARADMLDGEDIAAAGALRPGKGATAAATPAMIATVTIMAAVSHLGMVSDPSFSFEGVRPSSYPTSHSETDCFDSRAAELLRSSSLSIAGMRT